MAFLQIKRQEQQGWRAPGDWRPGWRLLLEMFFKMTKTVIKTSLRASIRGQHISPLFLRGFGKSCHHFRGCVDSQWAPPLAPVGSLTSVKAATGILIGLSEEADKHKVCLTLGKTKIHRFGKALSWVGNDSSHLFACKSIQKRFNVWAQTPKPLDKLICNIYIYAWDMGGKLLTGFLSCMHASCKDQPSSGPLWRNIPTPLSSLQSKVKYDFLYDHHHVCCQERWHSLPHRQAYTTFIMVALFLLPLVTMLFLYTRIGIELWIRKRVGDSSVLDTMNHREIGKISRYVSIPFSVHLCEIKGFIQFQAIFVAIFHVYLSLCKNHRQLLNYLGLLPGTNQVLWCISKMKRFWKNAKGLGRQQKDFIYQSMDRRV